MSDHRTTRYTFVLWRDHAYDIGLTDREMIQNKFVVEKRKKKYTDRQGIS